MNKKTFIWIAVIASISLMAFGTIKTGSLTLPTISEGQSCVSPYEPLQIAKTYSDFYYRLGPRFDAITKAQIREASHINDFLSPEEIDRVIEYYSISVVTIENDIQTQERAEGDSPALTNAQWKILRSKDLADHFTIQAKFDGKNKDALSNYKQFGPHFTVVPQRQAAYEFGEKALIDYLTEANKENTANLDEAKLGHAILYFTITAKGELTHMRLDRSCGSEKVEKGLIDLLENAPGKWTPAVNETGQKVNQELTIAFGFNGDGGGC